MRLVVALVVVLLGSVVAGCSDDAPSPDAHPEPTTATSADPVTLDDDVRAALAELYTGAEPDDEVASDGECFADALADRLTIDQLRAAGLVRDDGSVPSVPPVLDVTTAEAWVDASEACEPYVAVSARAFTAQSKGKIDAEAYAACFEKEIAPDRIRAALVASLSGSLDDPAVAELSTAQATCARGALPPD